MNETEKKAIEAIPADAVIQALKCCASAEDNCSDCPFKMKGAGIISESCITAMSRAALDLICRKQRTAEWVTTTETEDGLIVRYTHRCTDCNYFYKTVCPRGDDYCHKCGARMKGGE